MSPLLFFWKSVDNYRNEENPIMPEQLELILAILVIVLGSLFVGLITYVFCLIRNIIVKLRRKVK